MEPETFGLEDVEQFEASLADDEAPEPIDSAEAEGAPANEAVDASRAAPPPAKKSGKPQERWIGKRLSHFRIMRVVGAGNLGVVFQVEDVNLKRIAALKVLRRQAKDDVMTQQVERFLLEARTAAALDHPSIAHIFEINQYKRWWFIAMEFLEGGNLHDLVNSTGPLPPGRAALYLADAARGLAAAHEAGIIHRDLKPANLMLTRRGRCKLVDFGLVKLDSAENPFTDDDRLVVGTPHYVAPEVALGRGATSASDIYGLGATAYALLTGTPPFRGSDVRDVLLQHVKAPVPDVRAKAPHCPERLAQLIQRAMAKDPARRPDASALATALQAEIGGDFTTDSSTQYVVPTGLAPDSHSGSQALSATPAIDSGSSRGTLSSPVYTNSGSATVPVAAPTRLTRRRVTLAAAATIVIVAAAAVVWRASALRGAPDEPAVRTHVSVTTTNGIGMKLAQLPLGQFTLGSPPTEPGRNSDERMIKVALTRPVCMSLTEVTQQQWTAVMGDDYAPPEGIHPNEARGRRFLGSTLPAYVSWYEAAEFCRRLSLQENARYRLPTEAEWEYACRAGTSTPFHTGQSLSVSQANIDADVTPPQPHPAHRPMPVASFAPNAWGLYDMHGNVMEWCADWKTEYPLGPLTDPAGPTNGKLRVIRGGSWDSYARIARSANRWSYPPELRTDYIGFRVVLEPGAPPPFDQPPYLVARAPEPANATPAQSVAHAETTPEVPIALDPLLPTYAPTVILDQRVRSVGSDTMDRLMLMWERAFQQWHPQAIFRHEGKGSGTAIPALAEGLSHLGPMSRPIKSNERTEFQHEYGYELTQLSVAIDALAVYVHPANPVARRGLSLPELDAIFSSTCARGHAPILRWGDLGLPAPWRDAEIHLYGRNSASGSYGIFRSRVLDQGDFKATIRELVGSAEVVAAVAANRFGIGYSGIGYKQAAVTTVPLAEQPGDPPIAPESEAAYAGTYPLARQLYLTLDIPPDTEPSALHREFLRFIFSREGQLLVVEAGFFPLSAELAEAELRRVLPHD